MTNEALLEVMRNSRPKINPTTVTILDLTEGYTKGELYFFKMIIKESILGEEASATQLGRLDRLMPIEVEND
jgi:hypothetical protein